MGGNQKGEYAISVAIAGAVLLVLLAVQGDWQPTSLQDVASSAEEFMLTKAGLQEQLPEIRGYERVKTYRLGLYQAALYRASPAPALFAPGRFVVYNSRSQPVLKLETLEGSREPWTTVYDFAGQRGLPVPGRRTRPVYTRSLTGNGSPDLLVGQYSGGDHCCTTVSVVELGKDSVRTLGRIERLEGVPFEGVEIVKLDKDASWEIVAHRVRQTLCGPPKDAPDLLSVYAYIGGRYSEQTGRFAEFVEGILRHNLAKWADAKNRSVKLLQTVAAEYAMLGQLEEARRFFAVNLPLIFPDLQRMGVDPNLCLDDVESFLGALPSVTPPTWAGR